MRLSRTASTAPFALSVLLSLLSTVPAVAQTAITQTKANNGLGGCDAPGFPLTLCKEGSYRLTTNLKVPVDQHGVVITAHSVTLDLNGFTISGPCAGWIDTVGVLQNSFSTINTAVINGSVTCMGSGVSLDGLGSRVERVTSLN